MRRVELHQDTIEVILTGLTMLEAMQGRLSIPYGTIRTVHPKLNVRRHLLRMGGTSIGPIQEGHYIDGEGGWYFLSYENPDRVITLELDGFRLGRQPYLAVAVEVDDPASMTEAIQTRLNDTANPQP